jgi:hypothetical protein
LKTLLQSPVFLYRETVQRLTSAFAAAVVLLCLCSSAAFAQNLKKLSKAKDFYSKVSFAEATSHHGAQVSKLSALIETSDGSINATINVNLDNEGTRTAIGSVDGSKGSAVYFNYSGDQLTGRAVLPDKKKSYSYSTDKNGDVTVTEENIDKVICVDYDKPEGVPSSAGVSSAPPPTSTVYNLQSLPGAEAVVKLDFDGETVTSSYWNGGTTINAAPYDVTEGDVMEIWRMISEDFKAFNLNITTSETVYQNAPLTKRMKCIFTPTNFYSSSAGGVAYIGSFTWGNNTPCWVFNGGVKAGGETGSHEIGHTAGLSHDGRINPSETYYGGIDGAWAPIMGVGFYAEPVTWSKGEYNSANNTEDDLAIIAGSTNGFGYKTDDAGNTVSAAKPMFVRTGGIVLATENNGIITTNTDIDVFSFSTSGGIASFTVNGAQSYQNLNVALVIRNSSNAVIANADPAGTMNASVSANLPAGTYFLCVDGVGNGDPVTGGYSDYSSIGEYSISGTIQQGGNTPPAVTISSPVNNSHYNSPASFTVTATATDAEGSVTRVEFFRDGVKIGEDFTAPYVLSVTNLSAGTYIFTARGYDNEGLSAESAPVTIIVESTAPVVAITAPANNSYFLAGSSIAVAATASDPGGAVLGVQFYLNNVLVGYDSLAPYTFTIVNAAAGNHTLTARAIDFDNQSTVSAPVTIIADGTAPTVSIISPSNNSQFSAPASFEISTNPNDSQGPISKVEFFQNGVKIGEDLFYPGFGWSVSNLPAGTYTFTAKAYDQVGLSATSAPVTVVVNASTCILTEATPLASDYVVRNGWFDQYNGSSVTNENGALKVIHRAWGMNELYVIETGKSFNVTNGQIYNVKFDFRDYQTIRAAGVDIGFATGINSNNNGPVLVQPLVSAPAGYSYTNFTTKSLNITSAYTGAVKLVFRVRWTAQQNTQIVNYIKNITICTGAGTPARFADADFNLSSAEVQGISFAPNPSTAAFTATAGKEIEALSVADIHGRQMYSTRTLVSGQELFFGGEFIPGVYVVSVNYTDGTRDTYRLIKSE